MILPGRSPVALLLSMSAMTNAIFFPQFDTALDIPKSYFDKQSTIYGKVVRVIDGDTVRVAHCRSRFICRNFDENQRRIYDSTMSIRIYGVDAPELQKRKSDPPSQPFAEEAKKVTSDLVLSKKVQLKLLRRDQYGRAVAKVQTTRTFKSFPPFVRKDVSMELAKRGLATVYTGGGAEYDGNRAVFEDMESKARRKGRGIWSDAKFVSPAQFKRQQKLVKQSK
eukprot:scaffold1736_cov127-Cylindrotheca_fusiformis.AAC.92